MKKKDTNRTRTVGVRFSQKEYEQLLHGWKKTTCRKLSDYIRRALLHKPIVTTYRNQSMDDFMAELMRLRTELNSIGGNFNQAVHRLHMTDTSQQIHGWISSFEADRNAYFSKFEEVKLSISKMAELWLQ